MSILIKGIKPPKSCYTCSWYNKVECPVNDGRYYYRVQRHPSCPLIELPPHGRLIDADKFKADYSMKNDCIECEKELQGSSRSCEYDRIYSKMDFCDWIDIAPTVIEAEGSEE